MTEHARELNLDGLVGPTHHFGGLASGNVASQAHRHHISHPKQAALQGLEKMKRLADLGVAQAVLPPHDRPELTILRRLGFMGLDPDVIHQAVRDEPRLLSACYSASAMWAANAATVSPSADTADTRVHFTPANLAGNLHRCIEPPTTSKLLHTIFNNPDTFVHHQPLPTTAELGDEGAANHMRLSPSHAAPGVEVFVYGRSGADTLHHQYPARQTSTASKAIARLHGLDQSRTLLVKQNSNAIAAGAFHNDVVAVSHRNVLIYHEHAFQDEQTTIEQIKQAYAGINAADPILLKVLESELPLEDAISTYLFNSQIIDSHNNAMLLVCPIECKEHDAAQAVVHRIIDADNPIAAAYYVDLRQSMCNGGGPACLRLRVVLTNTQLAKIHQDVILTPDLYNTLKSWIERHYRDELTVEDLGDPSLLDESRAALDTLTEILGLGSVYAFQR